jgi:hypothetical protein
MPVPACYRSSRGIDRVSHLPNGSGKPDENRTADQRVADVHFLDFRDRGDRSDVRNCEAVAGVDRETGAGAKLGGA